jgi:hypothetical protein
MLFDNQKWSQVQFVPCIHSQNFAVQYYHTLKDRGSGAEDTWHLLLYARKPGSSNFW